jgi:hypothetical protein
VYSGFILPLLQVHLEQLGLVWRILLVGIDGFSYRFTRCLFYFRCVFCCTLNPGIVINVFLRLSCMKWSKYCKLVLIINPGYKMWIVRVLLLGVLDETTRFSSLSRYLVSSGRQMPPKAC